ncbi:hypothetical protein NGF19_02015 [Streptomyces sp. RY43-2]|uniref:Uncharacterized protein n=1 Tax=Streptomyces macrolidinus TaxID=2952607 RepID=A0ABT0Z724_9ACTN|nr:hypothetical protein [Streptomyces macrolidinus]MCN9239569.1 hypothetical protein [Streptomyces macrolidinus]
MGRPPLDEVLRQLRNAGEDPAELPLCELRTAVCELEAEHGGTHAGYLCEIDPRTQLWVRWQGDSHEFVRLAPCEAPADSSDDVCHLFTGHAPGHSWEMAETSCD